MSKVIKGRILYSQASYKPRPEDLEKGGGLSLTVPDESMSLRHILAKHSRGVDASVFEKEPVYYGGDFDDQDLEEVTRMDLAEKSELLDKVRSQVVDKKQAAEKAVADHDLQEKEKAEKAENALYEKFRSKGDRARDEGRAKAKGGSDQEGGTTD